jgi:hypothetical protein
MSKRAVGAALVLGLLAPATAAASPAIDAGPRATRVCTWGGTPAAATGTLEIKPGLTVSPSAAPSKIVATGKLSGGEGCTGTVTFAGVVHAGSTCATQLFEGKVKGLPGVERFYGPGAAGMVHEFLYDKDGNIVGADQAQVLSGTGQGSEVADCNTPRGFTHGGFSSVIELWG